MEYHGLILDRFQEEAIDLVDQKQSFIVCAPTGSGKTIIAEYAIEMALKQKKEIIYTAPIKVLSNQKFRDFTQRYGKEKVGIMTGDVTLNPRAPILIMTTEIFRNAIFEDSSRFGNVLYLILDEVHYLDNAERGSVWEESIIFAPEHIKILCLSATVPNVTQLSQWVSQIRKDKLNVVYEEKRSVPLYELCFMNSKGVVQLKEAERYLPKKIKRRNDERERGPQKENQHLEEIVDYLQDHQQIPCLYFVFSRKECEHYAFKCHRYLVLTPQEQEKVKKRLAELAAAYNLRCSPNDYGLGSLISKGIAYHHAGMLPALKEVVEQLFTEGFIKLLFATETFALGVNMPARSVVFSALKKYDGSLVRRLKAIEYQQMSGRAGRRGIDPVGYVYANLSDDLITIGDLQKIVKGPLEPINSQFNLSYSTLLNLYTHLGDDASKACDKSFAAFQKFTAAQETGGKRQKSKVIMELRQIAKKKLALLANLGYLSNGKLTSKGKFAIYLNGYEIQLTELFFNGLLEGKNEADLFVFLVSTVFEGKKNENRKRLPKEIRKIARQVERCVQTARAMESMLGLKEEIRTPDFGLSLAALFWASGKSFQETMNATTTSPGDVIRAFRLAIQLCRQLKKACEGYESFIGLLERCMFAVNRDEVNALKQLETFSTI